MFSKEKKVIGEICICGGAVMCLEHGAREMTKDVDALSFEPAEAIRSAAIEVAKIYNLSDDWINDGPKGFIEAIPPQHILMQLSNLKVWAPDAEFMLAMKCRSARPDGYDKEDIFFLIKHLKLKTEAEVTNLITKYFTPRKIPIQAQYIIREALKSSNKV